MQQKFVEIEYLDNDRVHIIHINDITRTSVDDYIQIIQSEILDKEDNLLLSVHNYSQLGGSITPYFLGRARQVASINTRTDMVGRVAMVTSMDVFRLLINPLMSIFSRENKKVTIKFFKTLDEAVEWVSAYQELGDS